MRLGKILHSTLLISIVSVSVHAEAPQLGPTVRLRTDIRESKIFVLSEGQRRLDLGRPFVIPGSDSVTVDGRILHRGDDYRINTLRGSIILVEPATGGEALVVRFSRYPFSFSPVFASRFPEGVPPLSVSVSPHLGRERKTERRVDPYRLRVSGSKTVGFSVGSDRGLGIDQSLKVTMVGTIAQDLEVSAFLTDDNLPVQPEGNTEELKHLDKVSVQVKSRHAEVQLGDFETGFGWSQFSSFQRELRGAMAKVGVSDQVFRIGGGIAKGRFKTASIIGREGVQGPYELLPARRFNAVIVLPGTETVYLDGRLLKRGSENDYTVDYNRGTVTFTEKVPITDDSEIVIDYQIGEDKFERTTVTAGWTSPAIGDVLRFNTLFFQESDDSDNPIIGILSDDERARLGEAGDDPEKAVASGIEEVEEGKGNYILVPADSLPAYFQFVESGGNYRLDFYEVGPGNGEYATDGFSTRGEVKYRYVGDGQGEYMVGRLLPLPERNRLFSLGARAETGNLSLDAEGNVSINDRNLLSDLDDGDNAGNAFRVEAGLEELPISSMKLSLRGRLSSLEDRFVSPDKPRSSYFYRNWNLEDVPLVGRENIGGALFRLKGKSWWKLGGSYEYLSRGADLSGSKGEFDASIGELVSRGLNLRAFTSSVSGGRERRFVRSEGVF